jgi:predicted SAM-dependent methyltransferase
MFRLNVGCGTLLKPGYTNVDKYIKDPRIVNRDICNLKYDDNSADEIFAQMVLEHESYNKTLKILEHWRNILKKDGVLIIGTINLDELCREWLNKGAEYITSLRGIYGSQDGPGMYHKIGFDFQSLKHYLQMVGFEKIYEMPTDHPHHLWVKAIK